MLDFDNLREIWSTMRKNKLRTFLTGFSVAWGIFMLVILLGAGNGLRNGVMYNFRDFSANRIEVWPRYTTKPWKGNRENRRLQLKNDDLAHLKTDFPEVDLYTGTVSHSDTLVYGEEYLNGEVREWRRILRRSILSGSIPEKDVLSMISICVSVAK